MLLSTLYTIVSETYCVVLFLARMWTQGVFNASIGRPMVATTNISWSLVTLLLSVKRCLFQKKLVILISSAGCIDQSADFHRAGVLSLFSQYILSSLKSNLSKFPTRNNHLSNDTRINYHPWTSCTVDQAISNGTL